MLLGAYVHSKCPYRNMPKILRDTPTGTGEQCDKRAFNGATVQLRRGPAIGLTRERHKQTIFCWRGLHTCYLHRPIPRPRPRPLLLLFTFVSSPPPSSAFQFPLIKIPLFFHCLTSELDW